MTQTAGTLVKAAVVAARYGVSTRTINRLAEAGRIPSYLVGRERRYDLDEVSSALRAAA